MNGLAAGLLAGLGRRATEGGHGALKAAPHRGDEELLLRAEQLEEEQHRLRDPDPPRDRLDRRAVEAADGKLAGGGFDDLAAPLFFLRSARAQAFMGGSVP